LQGSSSSYSIICDKLKKVYRGQDGNADKIAVRGISLSMSHGQCLGVLGPNGAGKTTFINMVSLDLDLMTLWYTKHVTTR
jgi:ABC-type multidrug transport system ATPase subunit